MNCHEAEVEALLRGAAVRRAESVPSAVASRMEVVLEGLPERTMPESRPRLRPLAAAGAVGAVGLAMAVVASFAAWDGWTGANGLAGQPRSHSAVMQAVGQIMPEADNMTGPSVTDQGITVMVREVVYDNFNVGLRYSVSSDRPIDLSEVDAELQLNDNQSVFIGSVPEGKEDPLLDRYQRTEEGAYEGAIIASTSVTPRKVQFQINKIGNIKGDWSFDVPVRYELARTIAGSVSRTNANGTFHLNKVIASSVSTRVFYGYQLGDFDKPENLGIEITDDTGQIYVEQLMTRGPLDLYSTKLDLPPLPKDAKSLRIQPYVFNVEQFLSSSESEEFRTEMKEQPTERKPLKLPLRDAATLDVTGIEYLPDRTVIHTQPVDYMWELQLLNGDGNPIRRLSLNNDNDIEFEPITPDTKLVFVTRGITTKKYIPELEIDVDLQKAQ